MFIMFCTNNPYYFPHFETQKVNKFLFSRPKAYGEVETLSRPTLTDILSFL